MKNGLILSVLLVVCAAGGGFWLGQHHAPAAVAPENPTSTDTPKTPGFMNQSGAQNPSAKPAASAGKNGQTLSGKMTLADIEAKILEYGKQSRMVFGGYGYQKQQQDLFKLLADVDAAEIPELLKFIDKNVTQQIRWQLRYMLLPRWARRG